MSKKMIQINPKYMSISNKNKKQQKQQKQQTLKNTKTANSGAMRKKLLNKIKDFQKKTEEQINVPEDKDKNTDEDSSFSNEFNKSLHFLQNLSNAKKKAKNKTKKNNSDKKTNTNNLELSNTSALQIETDLPKEMIENSSLKIPTANTTLKNNEPKYSCLKNGSKPTYREWKRKTQNNHLDTRHHEELNERERTLHQIKTDFQKTKEPASNTSTHTSTHTSTQNTNSVDSTHSQRYQRQIKTTRYKLGKDKTKKAISILIKNSNTRKKINSECEKLKKKSIIDVKNYLRKRNLLKAGSDAPPDVLRSMYENAVLTGDVKNESTETLLHNFLN